MKITATVDNTTFRNAENGYSVLSLTCNKKRLTAVGIVPEVFEGQTLELEGEFVVNKKFGEQFRIDSAKVIEPTTLPAIEKYLASGIIKGVGLATAKKLVKKFGEETIEVIRNTPERLIEVKGMILC